MPADPQCEDITTRKGAKDTYYYSTANMSDNYAMIAQLIEDKDLCVMFAEMVRFNARIYPSATPLKYFQRSPYGLAPEVIEQTWKAMQENPADADIEELTINQGYQRRGRFLRLNSTIESGYKSFFEQRYLNHTGTDTAPQC